MLTNATAQAETNEERVQIQNQINQIILQISTNEYILIISWTCCSW